VINEMLDHDAVLTRGEAVASRRGRHSVAGIVQSDASEIALQSSNDLPVEETQGGIAV
jgi:hypothetical protein